MSSEPSARTVLFARGVIATLALWPALRIAVSEGWGGPESSKKQLWLASVIVDAFEEQTPTPDAPYIEEMLLQIMADEFDTLLEDGSAEAVATSIMRLWEETQAGKQDLVVRLEEAEKVRGKQPEVHQSVESDDEEWEDSDGEAESGEEAPPLLDRREPHSRDPPDIDEDGFTLVKGRNKGHR